MMSTKDEGSSEVAAFRKECGSHTETSRLDTIDKSDVSEYVTAIEARIR